MITRRFDRVAASAIRALVIEVRGTRVLTDLNVAKLFGLTLSDLYQKIGAKLWCFDSKSIFKLPGTQSGGTADKRCKLAFDDQGVLMIAAILGNHRSLTVGLSICNVLKQSRTPANRRARPDTEEERLRRRLYKIITKRRKTLPKGQAQ